MSNNVKNSVGDVLSITRCIRSNDHLSVTVLLSAIHYLSGSGKTVVTDRELDLVARMTTVVSFLFNQSPSVVTYGIVIDLRGLSEVPDTPFEYHGDIQGLLESKDPLLYDLSIGSIFEGLLRFMISDIDHVSNAVIREDSTITILFRSPL